MTPGETTVVGVPATRADVIEQLMRVTHDETHVLAFLDPAPGSAAASAALGRLVTRTHLTLTAGCPLLSYVTATPVDPNWRTWYPPRTGSLHATLETYRLLNPPPGQEHEDLYAELFAYQHQR